MLSSLFGHDRSNLIFLFIALIVLFLPNLEAPKNIFFLGLLLIWTQFSFKSGNFGGRWNHFDSIFLLFLIVNILVAFNAHFEHNQPIKGANDIFRIIIFGWLISRIKFSKKAVEVIILINSLSILTLVTNFYTCPQLEGCMTLNSVGHVNHTAIYLLISFSLAIYLFIEKYEALSKSFKFLAFCYLIFLGFMIIATNSRAASGGLVIIILTLFVYFSIKKDWKKTYLIGFMVFVSMMIGLIHPPKVINKFYEGSHLIGDSPRQRIRNFAYEIFKIDPILGTGMSNFPNFDLDDIKANVIREKGSDWWHSNASSTYLPYAHPHNIYYVYLTGGGVVFLVTMLLFWFNIIKEVFKSFKEPSYKFTLPVIFILMINLIIGFVNTTFAHENGMLTMLVLGIFISYRRYGNSRI